MRTTIFDYLIFLILIIFNSICEVPFTTLSLDLLKRIPKYKHNLDRDCYNDYTCRESHVFRVNPRTYPKPTLPNFKPQDCEMDGVYITLGDRFVDSEKTDIYRIAFRISSLDCLANLKLNIFDISPQTGKLIEYESKEPFYEEKKETKRKFYVRNFRFVGVVQGVFYDMDKYYAFTNLVKEDLPNLGSFAYSFQVGNTIIKGPYYFKSKIIDYVNNLISNLEIIAFGDHDTQADGIQTLNFLKKEGGADLLLLLGDYAYDTYNDNGEKGRLYFKAMESIMTQQPTIILTGNHEWFDEWAFFYSRISYPGDPYLGEKYLFTDSKKDYTFNHNTVRDNMARDLKKRDSHHFFHFVIKDIFVVVINMDAILRHDLHFPGLIDRMTDLFERYDDANHKIFSSHRSLYCSQVNLFTKDCISNIFALQPINALMNYYNFNLVLIAHLHHYERLVPLDNFVPKYERLPISHYNSILSLVSQNKFQEAQKVPSTVIVTGSAGCSHSFTSFPNTDIEYLAFQKQVTTGFTSISLYKSDGNYLALIRFIPSNTKLDTGPILIQENVPRVFKEQAPLDVVIVFGSKGLKSESKDIFYIVLMMVVFLGMAILHFIQEKLWGRIQLDSEAFRLPNNPQSDGNGSIEISIMEAEVQQSAPKTNPKISKQEAHVKTNLIPK